jgi:hypothetical protein
MTHVLVNGYESPFEVLEWSTFKGYALCVNKDVGLGCYAVVSVYTGVPLSESIYFHDCDRTWRAIRKAETPFKGKFRLIYEKDVRACYQRYLDKGLTSDAEKVFEALPWLTATS